MKKIFFFCFFVFSFFFLIAQDVNSIKKNQDYYWGDGFGLTEEEAEKAAIAEISKQISMTVQHISKSETSYENDDGQIKEYTGENIQTMIQTSPTVLTNLKKKILAPEPEAHVFCYVKKEDAKNIFKEREQRIKDYIATAVAAEKHLQLDDALRCYYWALTLAKCTKNNVYIDFEGKQTNVLTYLPIKIKSVLSNIKVKVDNSEIKEDKTATLHFTYNGQDISSLDFKYFDGESFIGPVKIKDGKGIADFVSLPSDGSIRIAIEYRFQNDAENLDEEMLWAFKQTKPFIVKSATMEVPCKVNKKTNEVKESRIVSPSISNEEISLSGVEVKPEKTRTLVSKIEEYTTDKTFDQEEYRLILEKIEQAIKNNNPQDAYPYMTTYAYEIFKRMLKMGTMTIAGKSNYTFLNADNLILARSLPVKIRIKGSNPKTFMDNISFRFDPEQKKIVNLSFTLTKKAEDDIFNAASSWSKVSRFTILNFMEDYQTAYALKRLDYISSIFSDDALIIIGSVVKAVSRSDIEKNMSGKILGGNHTDNTRYKKYTKEQYLKNLEKSFKNNDYIHLTYEENMTRLINTNNNLPDDAVFGIQIKQIYNSSNYSDEGYLTLILDMQGKDPLITVRYWQPKKGDIEDLDRVIGKFSF
ncbi:MAG: hypothetical protein IJR03_03985 [Bacteroidales bacterium]|nr:hypothetical protein [Bacteroidales bacterium]